MTHESRPHDHFGQQLTSSQLCISRFGSVRCSSHLYECTEDRFCFVPLKVGLGNDYTSMVSVFEFMVSGALSRLLLVLRISRVGPCSSAMVGQKSDEKIIRRHNMSAEYRDVRQRGTAVTRVFTGAGGERWMLATGLDVVVTRNRAAIG